MKEIVLKYAVFGIYILVFPFIYIGLINKLKNIWCGRKGAPVLQPFYDFIKLLKKTEVISSKTTFVFFFAPVVSFVAVVFAALVVPGPYGISIISFDGDYIFFAYLLSLSKFVSIAGAMDTASSFEGMGAAREASFTSFVEPAYMMLLTTIVYVTGFLSFQQILFVIQGSTGWSFITGAPIIVALFIMLLSEGSRIPLDDPKTHLELTMIHEVMVLDNSGLSLALINYTSGLKMCVISSIIASVLIPQETVGYRYILLFFAIIAGTALIVGAIESVFARVKMSHVPRFVFTMVSVAIFVMAISFLKIFRGVI